MAGLLPCYAELLRGEVVKWCSCGFSASQPRCDGSHGAIPGGGFRPLPYAAERDEEVLFCACKRTSTPPFCDGSHNNLKDRYDEDDPDSPENRRIAEVGFDSRGSASLDGNCIVFRMPATTPEVESDGLRLTPLVSEGDGATLQSQIRIEAGPGAAGLRFGERQVILLVTGGAGTLTIGDRAFRVRTNDGAVVRPGEDFQLRPGSGDPGANWLTAFAASTPTGALPRIIPEPNRFFDADFPNRVGRSSPEGRRPMSDRTFEILADRRLGAEDAVQFIGEVPVSKAKPHRHLYEETLVVLDGRGMMWTETRRAAVEPGDAIFLPRKQLHSLQNVGPGLLRLAGVICGGDNPSINY